MANRSQFGSPPATGGSGGIGNVVGPSSAVNNNLAAFDTTTGELLKDSGIATSQVATSQTAVLEADFPKTNDTLANVTDLTLTGLLAGHWYRVTGSFIADLGAGSGAFDLGGGSATITGINGTYFGIVDGIPTEQLVTGLTGAWTWGGAGAGFTGLATQLDCVIQINAGGTVIARFAQVTTDVAASTLLKYATIQAIDVTPE